MTPLITDLAIVAVICLAGWGVEKVAEFMDAVGVALEARDEHE